MIQKNSPLPPCASHLRREIIETFLNFFIPILKGLSPKLLDKSEILAEAIHKQTNLDIRLKIPSPRSMFHKSYVCCTTLQF